MQRVQPGYAELETLQVWEKVKTVIKRVAVLSKSDPVCALAVSSLGEAVIPVTYDRQVLGPSLLNFDLRGEEFIPEFREILENERLYRINGNTFGNHYSLTKLLWLKTYQPELYEQYRSISALEWICILYVRRRTCCGLLFGEPYAVIRP